MAKNEIALKDRENDIKNAFSGWTRFKDKNTSERYIGFIRRAHKGFSIRQFGSYYFTRSSEAVPPNVANDNEMLI